MNHCIFSGKIISIEPAEQFNSKEGREFETINFQLEVSNEKDETIVPCRHISPTDTENKLRDMLKNLTEGQDVILSGRFSIRKINFGLTTISEPSIFVKSIELLKSNYNVIDEDDDYMIVDKAEMPF